MHHLTYTERLQIEKYYNAGMKQSDIARKLSRDPSTISREIKRGLYDKLDSKTYTYVQAYSADIADADAAFKATAKGGPLKLGKNYEYAERVSQLVHCGLSLDVIVGLFRNRCMWTVSTPTLYRYVDAGYIPNVTNSDLSEKLKRRKRTKKQVRALSAPVGYSIEQRPDIDDRQEFGHWEMDSVVGKSKGIDESILVLTERKTRYEIIVATLSKTAKSVVSALKNVFLRYGNIFKTVTVDNGSEFSDCDGMTSAIHAALYYCHSYSSWERGSNERNNRLIRRYLPKGTSFHTLTQADVDWIANAINALPRKILGYASANDLFVLEMNKF